MLRAKVLGVPVQPCGLSPQLLFSDKERLKWNVCRTPVNQFIFFSSSKYSLERKHMSMSSQILFNQNSDGQCGQLCVQQDSGLSWVQYGKNSWSPGASGNPQSSTSVRSCTWALTSIMMMGLRAALSRRAGRYWWMKNWTWAGSMC